MNIFQALIYFLREALRNLARGWRSSLLATLSIAVSLFLVGAFLLLGHNLSRQAREWEGRARLLVYARADAPPARIDALEQSLLGAEWAQGVSRVSPPEAAAAFSRLFPQLADLLDGGPGSPTLPTSFEIELRPAASEAAVRAAVARLERDAAVLLVDDDRQWLAELQTAAAALRLVGLALIGVLLGAALVTIGSVVRLKAYLDSDEITVLRLVGATEFYIRGPFYAEALALGALGGLFATAGLWVTGALLKQRLDEISIVAGLVRDPLPWTQAGALVCLGAVAGLGAAILSLRRERLGAIVET